MSLSTRTRFEVLKRDGFRCAYCGTVSEAASLHVDHIVPKSKGGGDELTNLITACDKCNLGKSDKPLGDVVPAVSEDAVEQAERTARAVRYAEAVVASRFSVEDQYQEVVTLWARVWGARIDGDRWVLSWGMWPDPKSTRDILKRLPVERVIQFVDELPRKFDHPSDHACRTFYAKCWSAIRSGDWEHKAAQLQSRVDDLEAERLRDHAEYANAIERIAQLEDLVEDLGDRMAHHRCPDADQLRLSVPKHIGEILRAMA